MINKKLFVLLVFLLFILHISFVCAVECNETDTTVEIHNNYYELSVNNSNEENFEYELNDNIVVFNENSLDFNQGDKIPITIDSSEDGILTVLIDDEMYGSWNFLNRETILIPTYNSASFYNSSIKNIDVGIHNISLIFKFNNFNNYEPIVSKEDSHLNFQFNKYTQDVLNNSVYTFSSTLNIHKKEKTIHISLLDKYPTYYDSIGFDVFMLLYGIDEDVNAWKDKNIYSFGIIISDKEGVIYKENRYVGEDYYFSPPEFDSNGIPCHNVSHSLCQIPGITHDIVRKLGICNLTIINFADGTQDSVLFNLYKFYFDLDDLFYTVNNDSITIQYNCFHFPEGFISVDGIYKFISSINGICDLSFVNLNPGVHVMTLNCSGTEFSEQIFYQMTFEINDSGIINNLSDNKLLNIINITLVNVSFNFFHYMFLNGNCAFLSFNSKYGLIEFPEWSIIENLNKKNDEDKFGDVSKVGSESSPVGDNSGGSSSSGSSCDVKSYEISKKPVSKSNDLFIQIGITFVSCMSFIVGFSRFKNKNK